jgi:hypothetical protein
MNRVETIPVHVAVVKNIKNAVVDKSGGFKVE